MSSQHGVHLRITGKSGPTSIGCHAAGRQAMCYLVRFMPIDDVPIDTILPPWVAYDAGKDGEARAAYRQQVREELWERIPWTLWMPEGATGIPHLDGEGAWFSTS